MQRYLRSLHPARKIVPHIDHVSPNLRRALTQFIPHYSIRIRSWIMIVAALAFVGELVLLGLLPISKYDDTPNSALFTHRSSSDSRGTSTRRPNTELQGQSPSSPSSRPSAETSSPSHRSGPGTPKPLSISTPNARSPVLTGELPTRSQTRTLGRNSTAVADPSLLPLHVLESSTNEPQTRELYLGHRGAVVHGSRWGWEPRCMPGFGRTGFSTLSSLLQNFNLSKSVSIPQSEIPYYRFDGTLYSNFSGELLDIGVHAGLSLWSTVPVYGPRGNLNRFVFIGTPPQGARDPLQWTKIERVPAPKKVLTTRYGVKEVQTSKPQYTERLVTVSPSNDTYECILTTSLGIERIDATYEIDDTGRVVIISCEVFHLLSQDRHRIASGQGGLTLHDKELDIYWNFTTPCVAPVLAPKPPEESRDENSITSLREWRQSSREDLLSRRLTAVLLFRNETCLLEEWISHYERLGFDHLYIYKQQQMTFKMDLADTILLKYVRRGLVTVVPFFDTGDCNPMDTLDLNRCQTYLNGRKTLFHDALYRFRADWMLLADIEDLLTVPKLMRSNIRSAVTNASESLAPSQGETAKKSRRDQFMNLLQLNAQTVTSAKDFHFGLFQLSYGTGPKSIPQPYCLPAGQTRMEQMHWHSEYAVPSSRFITTAKSPRLVSGPGARLPAHELVIKRYHRQYQGALDIHNQVSDQGDS